MLLEMQVLFICPLKRSGSLSAEQEAFPLKRELEHLFNTWLLLFEMLSSALAYMAQNRQIGIGSGGGDRSPGTFDVHHGDRDIGSCLQMFVASLSVE